MEAYLVGRVNVSRSFDTAKTLSTKSGSDLEEFISYTIDALDQLVREVNGGLSFGSNLNTMLTTVEVKHAVATTLNTGGKAPLGIIPLKVQSASIGITSYTVNTSSKGETIATFYLGSTVSAGTVTVPADLTEKFKIPVIIVFS